jgi:hypothetical protein
MDVLHPRCAGLDVHKDSVVAAVRLSEPGGVRCEVRRFDTTTPSTHPPRGAYRAWVKPAFDLTGVLASAGKDRRRSAQWRSSPG